jgi:HAMP domain-containing protein
MPNRLKHSTIVALAATGIACILAFAVLLLIHQLHSITKYNAGQAKLYTIWVNTIVQQALTGSNKPDMTDILVTTLSKQQNNGIISKVVVYADNGIIKTSTDTTEVGGLARAVEMPYITRALTSGSHENSVFFVDKRARVLHIYSLLPRQRQVIRLDARLGSMAIALQQIYFLIMAVILLAGLAFTLLGIFLFRTVITPIILLNIAAQEMAQGDSHLRIHIKSHNEISELADTITAISSRFDTEKHS